MKILLSTDPRTVLVGLVLVSAGLFRAVPGEDWRQKWESGQAAAPMPDRFAQDRVEAGEHAWELLRDHGEGE